jgi:hypothetical protein
MAKAISKTPEKKSEPIPEIQETLAIMDEINNDPNKVTNPWPRSMSVDRANEIIVQYKDFAGTEIPNDLLQARHVLGIK